MPRAAACPPSVCRAWMGAHHDPRAGEDWAPPGGRVPRPSRAPHRLPACAALGRPMPRRGFDGVEEADVADPMELADPADAMD